MKKRQKIILAALRQLGGQATIREIARRTGLNVNGVSQSFSALQYRGFVHPVSNDLRGPDIIWVNSHD